MSQRGFSSLVVIFAIIAIVIVGSSIFYFTRTKLPINPSLRPTTDKNDEIGVGNPDQSNSSQVIDESTKITQTNQSNNQITYKIDDYGIGFTLPNTFVRQSKPSNTYYANDLFFAKGTHNQTFRIYTSTKLNIEKAGYIKNDNDPRSSTFVKDPWNVAVGDRTGERFYRQGEICTPSQDIQVNVKNLIGDSQIIVVSFWGGYCDQEGLDQNVIDQILTSFKFSK